MKIVRTGIILLTSTISLFGQVDNEALTKIKTESDKNSQVMKIVSYLSDVYGPRLMGTPNYYNSILWTEEELKKWATAFNAQPGDLMLLLAGGAPCSAGSVDVRRSHFNRCRERLLALFPPLPRRHRLRIGPHTFPRLPGFVL